MTGLFSRRALVLSVLLLATSLYLARVSVAEAPPDRELLEQLPLSLGDWRGRSDPSLSLRIVTELGVDDYLLRTYERQPAELPVGLYVGYYRSQRQGDTMHSPLNCLPGAGWTPVETSELPIQIGSTEITVRRTLIQKGIDRQLVLYWYQSQGRVIASEYWGKIFTVVDAISRHRTDAALVRVITPLEDGSRAAVAAGEARTVTFVQELFPRLEAHIPD